MAVTNFIWNPLSENVLLETDENNTTVVAYTHGSGLYGKLLSQDRGGATSDYHYDSRRSTRQLTDANQGVTDTATYSAFGETVAKTGVTTNPFGYNGAVGYYTNSDTSDLYVRARTYDPTSGRWLSSDPLEFVDGPNTYSYVSNRPTAFMDPLGLYTLRDAIKSLESRGVKKLAPPSKIIDQSGNLGEGIGGTNYPGVDVNIQIENPFSSNRYSPTQLFEEWLRLEKQSTAWLAKIPQCPDEICIKNGKIKNCNNGIWNELKNDYFVNEYHDGADYCMRSIAFAGSAQQCCYEQKGQTLKLIKSGEPAGTPDLVAATGNVGTIFNWFGDTGHIGHDLTPYLLAKQLGRYDDYLKVRPLSQGGGSCYLPSRAEIDRRRREYNRMKRKLKEMSGMAG